MEYKIDISDRAGHYLRINFSQIIENSADSVIFTLPAWRPGRYELSDYAKNIRGFFSVDEKNNSLPFEKVGKNQWKVYHGGAKEVHVEYEYFAFQMDAGSSWLDEHQVYINFVNCMMYVQGREGESCKVYIDFPKEYKIASGLTYKEGCLSAESYYELADSPTIASPTLTEWTYTSAGKNFHVWIQGSVEKLNKEKLIGEFKGFTDAQLRLFKEFPSEDYHFLFQVLPFKHYHGVEHAKSTVITIGPAEDMDNESLYSEFLGVSSHELFHFWNVCRIRSEELVPYDFSREVIFDTGFVLEGFTTYYGDLFLARGNVFDVSAYFRELNMLFKRHFGNPGRHFSSLALSSQELWLTGYKPGPPFNKVSIYVKGAIVSLMLDMTIRLYTGSRKSLDDLMLILWERIYKRGQGYSKRIIQEYAEELCGESLEGFFRDYIDGTVPVENKLDELLKVVGCSLTKGYSVISWEKNYGFKLDGENKVVIICPNSPAKTGLSVGDTILKVDGLAPDLNRETGTMLELEYIRGGITGSIKLIKGETFYFPEYKINFLESRDEGQKAAFEKWVWGENY